MQNFPFIKSHSTRVEDEHKQLEAFKQQHGHTNVTATDNKMLCTWVKNVGAQYKKGDIDNNLVKSLNDMGFEWVLSKDV